MAESVVIKPVRWSDLPRLTHMVFQNMMGVDQEFTARMRNPLRRVLGYIQIPLYLALGQNGFKALVNRHIAGAAYVHIRELSAYVYNVNVNRTFRRRGVGSELMAHLEGVAQQAHVPWVALIVDRDNSAARRLYESLGYRCYFPLYLRRVERFAHPYVPPERLRLEAISGKQARVLYHRYLRIECRAGDAWAASAVLREYEPPMPQKGTHWRCLDGETEFGYAWFDERRSRPVVQLLLKPAYWQGRTARALIQQRLSRQTIPIVGPDLHVGSSAHLTAIAADLAPLGYQPREQARLLMLKLLPASA